MTCFYGWNSRSGVIGEGVCFALTDGGYDIICYEIRDRKGCNYGAIATEHGLQLAGVNGRSRGSSAIWEGIGIP